MFANKGKPVHCLSPRFEGVSYRVSMLIGEASFSSKERFATSTPTSHKTTMSYDLPTPLRGRREGGGMGGRAKPVLADHLIS